ncbi:hypothetical protein [Streptomyces sp. AA1529]|nr:hypothetical protein [Streptomyces sp. AA1529]
MSNNLLYDFKGSLRSRRAARLAAADAPVFGPLRSGRLPARGREP